MVPFGVDVEIDEKTGLYEHELSLAAVMGRKIKGVAGWVSGEFGDDTLVFKITRIVFDDNSFEDVEGEHDLPYIASDEEHQALFEPHYDPNC